MAEDEGTSGKKTEAKRYDHFWLQSVFPDAAEALLLQQRAITDAKANCLVVLDANVLLMPYELGARSLTEIIRVYKMLADEGRLFVPGQAAREFVKNRGDKVRDIVREISNQVSKVQIPFDKSIGFLDSDDRLSELKKLSKKISDIKIEIMKQADLLKSDLSGRIGGDPVSLAYQSLFTGAVVELIVEEGGHQHLVEELQWRFKHDIPPGYKDRSKPDEGIGDYIIWKTILQLGAERKLDCIFVTKDAKGDWWVQSEGAFQPRIELLEEYRRASGGMSVHLAPLSDLLSIFDAQKEVVEDAKRVEEPRQAPKRRPLPASELLGSMNDEDLSGLAIYGLNALDRLTQDSFRKYAHRHRDIESLLSNPGPELEDSNLESLYREKAEVWELMTAATQRRGRIAAEIRRRLGEE